MWWKYSLCTWRRPHRIGDVLVLVLCCCVALRCVVLRCVGRTKQGLGAMVRPAIRWHRCCCCCCGWEGAVSFPDVVVVVVVVVVAVVCVVGG